MGDYCEVSQCFAGGALDSVTFGYLLVARAHRCRRYWADVGFTELIFGDVTALLSNRIDDICFVCLSPGGLGPFESRRRLGSKRDEETNERAWLEQGEPALSSSFQSIKGKPTASCYPSQVVFN